MNDSKITADKSRRALRSSAQWGKVRAAPKARKDYARNYDVASNSDSNSACGGCFAIP
jgi:hypothetical protein